MQYTRYFCCKISNCGCVRMVVHSKLKRKTYIYKKKGGLVPMKLHITEKCKTMKK